MTATWGDLFERAGAYDATEADVRRALAERREDTSGSSTEDGNGNDDP